jgi:hypothetical protein
MSDGDNILPFQRPPAPVEIKKPAADTLEWIDSLDSMNAVRRVLAAAPNVERALAVINQGSTESIIRKAIEK